MPVNVFATIGRNGAVLHNDYLRVPRGVLICDVKESKRANMNMSGNPSALIWNGDDDLHGITRYACTYMQGMDQVFVCGGAELFREVAPFVDGVVMLQTVLDHNKDDECGYFPFAAYNINHVNESVATKDGLHVTNVTITHEEVDLIKLMRATLVNANPCPDDIVDLMATVKDVT